MNAVGEKDNIYQILDFGHFDIQICDKHHQNGIPLVIK
jgi:hypothetical protein